MNFKSGWLVVLAMGSICFLGARQEQQPVQQVGPLDNAAGGSTELADRVNRLEARVEILERVLFSTEKVNRMRAERLLEDRKNRLKHSRRLFAQGMINEAEVQIDKMRLEEAEREHALATAESKERELTSKLELAEAERRLKFAQSQLAYKRNMARKGYASKSEVERLEKAVDIAKQELEHAKLRLKATSDLEGIEK